MLYQRPNERILELTRFHLIVTAVWEVACSNKTCTRHARPLNPCGPDTTISKTVRMTGLRIVELLAEGTGPLGIIGYLCWMCRNVRLMRA